MHANRKPLYLNGLARPTDSLGSSNLKRNYTFANFVTGKVNEFARDLGLQVAKQPVAPIANPLVIVGGKGLGKTHLLHAIGNQMCKANPDARIRYIHSRIFLDTVVLADRSMEFEVFRQQFHPLGLLLLDDIHCLNGKLRAQEKLHQVFNALISNRKKIVITSSCLVGEIENMSPQLAGHFTSGMAVKLEQPDIEFRRAILHAKAAEDNILLEDEVAIYLAHIDIPSVREIETILRRIVAASRYLDTPISLWLVKEALKGIYEL